MHIGPFIPGIGGTHEGNGNAFRGLCKRRLWAGRPDLGGGCWRVLVDVHPLHDISKFVMIVPDSGQN